MYRRLFLFAVATALLLAFPAKAETADAGQITQPPTVLVDPAPRPPPPAFNAGELIVDRLGVQVGPIETLTEAEAGLVVVIKIDGKLVGVPASTLKRDGDKIVSLQSRAEMLAAAGAPNTAAAPTSSTPVLLTPP